MAVPRARVGGWVLTEELECLVFGLDEAACSPLKFGDEFMEFEGVVDQRVGSF